MADTPVVDILCHRGLWADPAEQNTLAAFRAAWQRGWGVELDVRDLDGDLVVSHDAPRAGALPLRAVLDAYAAEGAGTPIAVNVKADGLASRVATLLASASADAFAFDMSVPDQLAWLRAGVPTYSRWSDVEPDPVLLAESAGVWLDAFSTDTWWSPADVSAHAEAGRAVAVVSPELHHRDPRLGWDRLVAAGLHTLPGAALCTDRPYEWLEHCA